MNYNMFDEIDYFTNFKGNSNQDNNMNSMNNINNIKINNNLNMNSKLDLFSPYEGYIKGNLYKNLYEQYKNYRPNKINVRNEQEEMLLNVGQISFAAHELNLYLDNYPNDQNALELFNRYSKNALKLREDYENKFGPLVVSDSDTKIPFSWESKKWPGEV